MLDLLYIELKKCRERIDGGPIVTIRSSDNCLILAATWLDISSKLEYQTRISITEIVHIYIEEKELFERFIRECNAQYRNYFLSINRDEKTLNFVNESSLSKEIINGKKTNLNLYR